MSAQNGHGSYKIILDCETEAQVGDDLSPASQQGYTGHVGDSTGLVYMQARYYDPVIGWFYSNDPVGFKGVHSFNRYAYANNNPYKYVDPDGRETRLMVEAHHLDMDVVNGNMTQSERLEISGAQSMGVIGAATLLVPGREDLIVAGALAKVGRGAESAVNGVKLEKQLASEAQVTELAEGGGKVLSQPAKQANRIAEQHGVDPANVQKVSSSAHTAKDGSQVQTNAFRDASTNKVIEPKSIIDETN